MNEWTNGWVKGKYVQVTYYNISFLLIANSSTENTKEKLIHFPRTLVQHNYLSISPPARAPHSPRSTQSLLTNMYERVSPTDQTRTIEDVEQMQIFPLNSNSELYGGEFISVSQFTHSSRLVVTHSIGTHAECRSKFRMT